MPNSNSPNFCSKCGQAWVVHNDDGSCVDDDVEARVKASMQTEMDNVDKQIQAHSKESPLEWAMKEIEKYIKTPADSCIVQTTRTRINEKGNVELVFELTPFCADIIGNGLKLASGTARKEKDDSE
jgi:hypothetical protein